MSQIQEALTADISVVGCRERVQGIVELLLTKDQVEPDSKVSEQSEDKEP
jgi:hypothetical protein